MTTTSTTTIYIIVYNYNSNACVNVPVNNSFPLNNINQQLIINRMFFSHLYIHRYCCLLAALFSCITFGCKTTWRKTPSELGIDCDHCYFISADTLDSNGCVGQQYGMACGREAMELRGRVAIHRSNNCRTMITLRSFPLLRNPRKSDSSTCVLQLVLAAAKASTCIHMSNHWRTFNFVVGCFFF